MKAREMYLMEFTVRGIGAFPVDMLRYDDAHPHTESDAARMQAYVYRGADATDARDVVLRTYQSDYGWRPSAERWRSFGWRVQSCGIIP